mmetsp:Transcript_11924/g.32586  ORF Transcript_11924/g.32586 Transcript_11924/m.32586 type:complete len:286 (+) Transcript_11924:1214-2071(+)
MAGGEGGADSVADLMVSHQALGLAVHQGLALHASNNAVNAVINLGVGDGSLAPTARQDSCLIQQVGQVSTSKAGGAQGHLLQVHILRQLLVACMHLQDSQAALLVRHIHRHLAIESAWTQQSRVQNVGTVGGCDDNDASVALEAIHLSQQLVQGLLTLIVATANARATGATHSINLIHEDQAGGILLGLLEKVTHTAGTHTHEHLHELGTGDGEERHTSLTSNCLGQQGLSGTGGAYQQASLGNAGTHSSEALRSLQELHNLSKVLLGLLHTSHIIEHHASVGLH